MFKTNNKRTIQLYQYFVVAEEWKKSGWPEKWAYITSKLWALFDRIQCVVARGEWLGGQTVGRAIFHGMYDTLGCSMQHFSLHKQHSSSASSCPASRSLFFQHFHSVAHAHTHTHLVTDLIWTSAPATSTKLFNTRTDKKKVCKLEYSIWFIVWYRETEQERKKTPNATQRSRNERVNVYDMRKRERGVCVCVVSCLSTD